ncbi:MAG: diaminopimelate epimerase [Granulosicoccaceae bacterium]
MKLEFAKMHGLGNDFMVIDATQRPMPLDRAAIERLSNRTTGIGFDQLLVVEPPGDASVDFNYRIYNADGGEVEHCGNGARCFAVFVRRQGLSDKTDIPVRTHNGDIRLQVHGDDLVTVNMGTPNFDPASLPFTSKVVQSDYALEVAGEKLTVGAVSMGNPHAVLRVDDIETAPVLTLGPLIENHRDFPRRVNAGFMQIHNDHHISLRVFERGVGETQACGTGACAAVAVGSRWGLLGTRVEVDLVGGQLTIEWEGEGTDLRMTGPAAHVYDGTLEL